MRWHVNCCIWLMLVTVFVSGDQIADTKKSVKRNIKFDEVADFADVVEPESNAIELNVKALQPVRREVRPSLFKRSDYEREENDDSTLKLGLVDLQSDVKNNNDVELALKGVEEPKIEAAPKKRSLSKKYSNLLELKYYYARGLPVRDHFNINSIEDGRNKELASLEKSPAEKFNDENIDDQNVKAKRSSHVNILPIMSEHNPYMSGLADATNDAYLKMRNYAATLMVILTTSRSTEAKLYELRDLSNSSKRQNYFTTEFPITDAIKTKYNPVHVSKHSYSSNKDSRKVGQTREIGELTKKNHKKQKLKKNPNNADAVNLKGAAKFVNDITNTDRIRKDIADFSSNMNEVLGVPMLNNVPVVNPIPLDNTVAIANAAPTLSNYNSVVGAPEQRYVETQPVNVNNVRQSGNNEILTAKIKTAPHTNSAHHHNSGNIKRIGLKSPGRHHLIGLKGNATAKGKLKKNRKKITTESPFLWENNLLKEANIKVKRTTDPEKTSNEDPNDIPMVTKSSNLEISSKLLTPRPNSTNTPSCVINKAPEADDDKCEDEEEETDEECGNKESVNNTCGGFNQVPEKANRRRKQANTGQPQNLTKTEDGGEASECPKFFTLPVKQIHEGLDQAINNVNAPERKLSDIINNATHKEETNNNISTNDTASLDSSNIPSNTDSGMEAADILANQTKTQTVSTPQNTTATAQQNASISKVKKETHKFIKKLYNIHKKGYRGIKRQREIPSNDLDGTNLIDNFNDKSIQQLERLRRDLFVANELQELLNKLRQETARDDESMERRKRELNSEHSDDKQNPNFYKPQNSQYLKQQSYTNPLLNEKFKRDNMHKKNDMDKRFLFKKKRKKKKSKSIWKHLFGVHEDDNRFLNQNFPNSQYAIYPN